MTHWGSREQAAKHYGCSLSTIDRLRNRGIIRSSKIPDLGLQVELIQKGKLTQRYLLHPLEVVVSPPKKKQRLDISLVEYDRRYLIGDSAVTKKRQRWCFRRKGVFIRRLNSGNHSWCYWYYDENGTLKKASVSDATCREDAIIAMDAKVEEVRRKKLKIRSITFREFAPIYLEKGTAQKRSRKTDKKFIEGRLVPYFGEMLLTEITPEHVSEFIAQFKPKVEWIGEVKGSTINKHLQVLSRMFTVAKKFRYETDGNPVDRELHFADEAPYRRKTELKREQDQGLKREAAPHLRPIIDCMLLQGMRPQTEVLGLKISDLDLDAEIPTITIRPEINKTGKPDIIPIRAKMAQIFKQLIKANGGRSEYVFNYDDPHTGEYRHITTFRRSFNAACRRAGIEGLQPRDLRRTCATRLHEAGAYSGPK